LELLDQQAVHRTVLFFGSARAKTRSEWEAAKSEATRASDETGLASLGRIEWMCEWYDKTVALSRAVAEWQASRPSSPEYVIATGGGPGLMEAANKGAQEGGARSMGVAVSLPFEARMNPFVDPELSIMLHYFSTRKMVLADPACAIVALPGGFGTMDELFELATLLQTGKVGGKHDPWKAHMPIVLFGATYWNQIMNLQAAVELGTLAQEDVDRLVITDSSEEALAAITSGLERVEAAWEAGAASGAGGATAASASRGRASWGGHYSLAQGGRHRRVTSASVSASEGGASSPDTPASAIGGGKASPDTPASAIGGGKASPDTPVSSSASVHRLPPAPRPQQAPVEEAVTPVMGAPSA
jgi:uncharacterized protein (TIGR00730 family)